jgi:hypothetical protein
LFEPRRDKGNYLFLGNFCEIRQNSEPGRKMLAAYFVKRVCGKEVNLSLSSNEPTRI